MGVNRIMTFATTRRSQRTDFVSICDSRLVSVETGIYQPTFKISTSAKNSIYLPANKQKKNIRENIFFYEASCKCLPGYKATAIPYSERVQQVGKGVFDVCSSRRLLNEPNPCLISFAFIHATKTVTTICFCLVFGWVDIIASRGKGIDFFVNRRWGGSWRVPAGY